MSVINRVNDRLNASISNHKVAANIIAAGLLITVSAVSAAYISLSAVMAEASYVSQPVVTSVASLTDNLTVVSMPDATANAGNLNDISQLQPADYSAYESQASATSLQPSANDIQLTASNPQNAAGL